MKNIAIKVDGSSTVDSSELNSGWSEEKNAVLDSGQALSAGDDFQVSTAAAINAAGADYYDDLGVADAYVISKPGTSSLRSPPAYFEGQRIRFRPTNNNTGGSTVNVTGVGVVSILKEDGVSALSVGDLVTGQDAECRYDIVAGAFLLKSKAPDATQSSKGIAFLAGQRIISSNNAIDPTNDIDFSGGRFAFSDGTGEAIAPVYTKQLDAAWVAGNAQGGLPALLTIADTTYHCFALYSPTSGAVDYGFDTSVTAANLLADANVILAGITKYKRVWSITRRAGVISPFVQVGNRCYYKTEFASFSASVGTSAQTATLDTPLGIEVLALVNGYSIITGSPVALPFYNKLVRVFPTSFADVAVTTYNAQITSGLNYYNVQGTKWWRNSGASAFEILADVLGQVSIRSSDGQVNITNLGTFLRTQYRHVSNLI